MNSLGIKVKGKFEIVKRVIKMAYEDDIFSLSSQLAYNLLLALFPFIIFLLTIVGYSNISTSDVMEVINHLIPKEVFKIVEKIVSEVVHKRNGSLLSVSLIITIWTAASGFNAVIKGLNKAYREKECRSIIRVQLISLIFTFALVIIIMFVVFLLVFGEVNGYLISKWFGFSEGFKLLWNMARFVLTTVIMIILFDVLYIFAPCKRHSFKEVLPGAIFVTLGWLIISSGFSYYVGNFTNYSKLYGSLGAVMILMFWLLLSSMIIIIGGEINSVSILERNKKLNYEKI